jgi:hypothetical protein
MLLETGTCKIGAGEEVELDLTLYDVEVSTLSAGISRWLKMK